MELYPHTSTFREEKGEERGKGANKGGTGGKKQTQKLQGMVHVCGETVADSKHTLPTVCSVLKEKHA